MEHLICEVENGVGVLKVNRPEVLNALNRSVLNELLHFLQVTALEMKIKTLILTGADEKAFIAGADVKEMQDMNAQQIAQFILLGQNVANALETAPFVTIAAINGYALGGGLEMALACDFIYASQKAVMGLPEVSLGIIPGFGGTQRLVSAVGLRRAKEMIMTAQKISAHEGYDLGIVNKVCAPESLLEECLKTASKISHQSFSAIVAAKNAINCGTQLGLSAALELERNVFEACFDSSERRIAIKEFLSRQG